MSTETEDLIEPALDGVEVQAYLSRLFPKRSIDRVLLVTPPDGPSELFRTSTAKRKRYSNWAPYGLAVLAQQLRRIGIRVDLLNLNHAILVAFDAADDSDAFDFDGTWKTELDKKISEFQPDLIGVTCMFTMTHTSLKRVCQHASKSGIPVAIGGVHATNDVERVLSDIPDVRMAFTHEADVSLKTFCQVVSGRAEIQNLGQLVLVDGQKRYRFPRLQKPEGEDLDVIPAHDLTEVASLSQFGTIGNFYGFKPKGTRIANVLANRGCRAKCTFCSVRNFNGAGVRQRSVDSVLDELELLKNEYGVGHITWLDDDLLFEHRHAVNLFNGMAQRKLGLTWDATNGVIAASCNEEMVHAMAESGCIAFNIGVESGNPVILRQVKKPGTPETFLKAAEVVRRFPQIHTRAFLMIGFPGETFAMINDTIKLAEEMSLDWYAMTTLQPLPNTPVYVSMVQQGLIQDVGSFDVRFNSGGYGKQNELDRGERSIAEGLKTILESDRRDEIPTPGQLDDMWFYMNYHLNFRRLFSENRPIKIQQQLMNLRTISDVISPEHGLALYFLTYLEYKQSGNLDTSLIERLENKLEASDYWRNRLSAVGLSIEDLKPSNFKNRELENLRSM